MKEFGYTIKLFQAYIVYPYDFGSWLEYHEVSVQKCLVYSVGSLGFFG